MKNNDILFAEKNVFSQDMYVSGLYPAAKTETDVFIKREGEDSQKGSFAVPLRCGSIYVVRFDTAPDCLRAAACGCDPRSLSEGEGMASRYNANLPYFENAPDTGSVDFMYVPQTEGEYLIIYTGSDKPVFVGENPVVTEADTDDCWYYPPEEIFDENTPLYDWRWSSDEIYEKIYEPLRAKYPGYITRSWIGKDDTNSYDMYAYFFEPQNYEQTLFLTGGVHGEECDGYLGLARFLTLMAQEDGSNAGLHYLRTRVRLIVVPVVNVWGASAVSRGEAQKDRCTGSGVNLNGDFALHSQAETVNVLRLIHLYKDEIACLIDFHTAIPKAAALYYQFSMQAGNSDTVRKVSNHIFHTLSDRGWVQGLPQMWLIPGKYNKDSKYLQGYVYNHFGIPTLVAEHNQSRWYEHHSAQSLRHAVECYGNHIIHTALAKLKITSK